MLTGPAENWRRRVCENPTHRQAKNKSGIFGQGNILEKNFSKKYMGTCLMNNLKEPSTQIAKDCKKAKEILATEDVEKDKLEL